MRIVPPGDDVVRVPDPLDATTVPEHFCDLVMTGGVASGVVYPWAVVEIARTYRLRNIGGTSVGAMAAVLAAAAEYGRLTNANLHFEVLRRMPAALGEPVGDHTRMMSLFQANPDGERLMRLWGQLFQGGPDPEDKALRAGVAPAKPPKAWRAVGAFIRDLAQARWKVLASYVLVGVLAGALCGVSIDCLCQRAWPHAIWMGLIGGCLGLLAGLLGALWLDIRRGIIENHYGLCKGGTMPPVGGNSQERPGITDWLHEGIQGAAGLHDTAPPLSFRDLWRAPMARGLRHQHCDEHSPVAHRSINLQVITTNLTHGRPYRLPLQNDPSRLFFDPDEWADYFPATVIRHLKALSKPYAPACESDPKASASTARFLELPGADLPIVVAARLSLSFPGLFAAVPLWAIDYSPTRDARVLARCLFIDGGTSSNFPIHLFDAAVPRWPTFGLWLDLRDPAYKPRHPDESHHVWLPRFINQGWGDRRDPFDDERQAHEQAGKPALSNSAVIGALMGYVKALFSGATDWHDRTTMRLPHMRTRIARMLLLPAEGGLNIGMPREQILRMASNYGSTAGRMLVAQFRDKIGQPSLAWKEHRWVRMAMLINSLRETIGPVPLAAGTSCGNVSLSAAINQATTEPPLREPNPVPNLLTPAEAAALQSALTGLSALAATLNTTPQVNDELLPHPELRMRAPL